MAGQKVKNAQNPVAPKKKKNALLIIVAAVSSFAVALGIVLGIISYIASRNAVMEYEGVRMDQKVASYLISVYKPTYIGELKKSGITYAADTEEFWAKENPDGSGTFGAAFEKSAERYLKEILVGTYLHDRFAKLSEKEEESIKKSADSVLEYSYNTEGFDALFEIDAAKMGYDYDAYQEAALMLYKSSVAWRAVYGASGEAAASLKTECNEYLNLYYSHVDLAFVRTQSTFELDADGNRIEEMGTFKLKKLVGDEPEKRAAEIERVKAMIDAYNSGTSTENVITPETVKTVANTYISDQSAQRIEKGYYFSPYSEYSASFSDEYNQNVNSILEMALSLTLDQKGQAYGYCDIKLNGIDGPEPVTCFIYKSTPATNAYADADLSDFFTDFFEDASRLYIHPKDVSARCAEVEVKEKFGEMQISAIPQNNKHKIKEFVME